MRRALWISLALLLALVYWSPVGATDAFYVVPAMKGNYAPVPKSGQTTPYSTGDDGSLQKGVASPTPRFTDNNNGTVTDNLTGLIWMKNANAFSGTKTWDQALSLANNLKDPDYGLSDGSVAGDWRLPNLKELLSLIDYGRSNPALPAGHLFDNVQSSYPYWSSTTDADDPDLAWDVGIGMKGLAEGFDKAYSDYVWCVRGGR